MKITFDPAKRDRTSRERGLDFADADQVFAGKTPDRPDERHDYGELRMITVWLPAKTNGDRLLDASERHTARLFDEESQ